VSPSPPGIKGQALLEWTLFGLAALILWTATLHLARRALALTVAESWSGLAARQALSGAPTPAPRGVWVMKSSRRGFAPGREVSAVVHYDGATARTDLFIPRTDRLEVLPSLSPFFGFLFSRSSE